MRAKAVVQILALAMLSLGGASGEFVTFAECDTSVTLFDADEWDVPVLKATLSMTAPIDTYAQHYNYVAAGTGTMVNLTSGQSRLEVTLAVEKESGASGAFSTKAYIHASRCEINSGGSHFLHDVTGTDSGDNIVLVEHDFSGGVPSPTVANVTRGYLLDYERAASVVVHAPDGTPVGCCNLVPRLPTLPDTWSAVIEANINHEGEGLNSLSYSMLRYEWYDASTNNLRIDEHSSYSKQTRIVNTEQDTVMFMHRNGTHPAGFCEHHKVSDGHFPMFGRGSGNGLSSTADFLQVTGGNTPIEYHGVTEASNVRGIPCEKWTRNVSIPSFSDPSMTVSYIYEFYFPISSWMIRRESFHRMLSRIVVRSDSGMRGRSVLHYYDFIDFKPEVDNFSIFNPCEVYNSGAPLSGNCTCGLPGIIAPTPSAWASRGGGEIDALRSRQSSLTAVVVVLALVLIASFAGSSFFRWREEKNARLLVNDNEMSSF